MSYRGYEIYVIINGIRFSRLEIDDHYEIGHDDHMTDDLILELVSELHRHDFKAVWESNDGVKVFVIDPLMFQRKPYRLVWFYNIGSHTLSVRTAFRTRRKK